MYLIDHLTWHLRARLNIGRENHSRKHNRDLTFPSQPRDDRIKLNLSNPMLPMLDRDDGIHRGKHIDTRPLKVHGRPDGIQDLVMELVERKNLELA